MSTLERYATNVLHDLPEEKMLAFLTLFADDNTLARFETECMANNPNRKRYNSFAEIMAEIEGEDA